jgi:ABC-type Fe3+-hydroxamate transport system substrate-binding protein
MERETIHMKKALAAGAFLCLALAGCAGGATQAAPAVTQIVTQTATETVTATATATVTAAPQPAEVVAAAPAVPATAVIPADVAGMNAEALDDDLTALGFKKVIYNSDTGKTVLLLSNWTVTGVDRPGTKQSVDKAVVVHVTK